MHGGCEAAAKPGTTVQHGISTTGYIFRRDWDISSMMDTFEEP